MTENLKDTVRIHLDLSAKHNSMLRELSEITGTTLSEVMRRAISIYALFTNESQKGSVILIRTKDGKEREIVLL